MTAARVYPLVLVAAVLAAYQNSFSGLFLLDDRTSIVESGLIRDLGETWRALPGDLRPVVTLSFALNYAAGGLELWGYHAVNVAVHTAAAVVLFGLVRRTLLLPRSGGHTPETAARLAFAAALLWAVHPLDTQSVTYVVQRAQSLMGLLHLTTLYCVLRGAIAAGRGRLGWYTAAVVACAAGMGSKQDMVVVPVAVALYDRVFLAGSWRGVVRARWGLYLALAATWAVLAPSFRAAVREAPAREAAPAAGAATTAGPGATPGPGSPPPAVLGRPKVSAGLGMADSTPVRYALTQSEVILHYLRLAVWPRPLCLDYADWPLARGAGDVAPALAVVVGLLVLTGVALWLRPGVGFLGAWFFLTLAPSSSVLPIADVAFEHRTYLPLAALATLAVLGAAAAGRWAVRGGLLSPAAARAAGWAALAVAAGALGWGTVTRNELYRSDVAMWEQVLALRPGNWRAHNNLGIALARNDRPAEAAEQFGLAARTLSEPNPGVHAMWASELLKCGRPEEAVSEFREAIRIAATVHPVLPSELLNYHINLAVTLRNLKRWPEAAEHFRQIVRLAPTYAPARLSLGNALGQVGDWAGAAECLEDLLAADPRNSAGHNEIAMVLVRLGRLDEAEAHFRTAVRLAPGNPVPVNNLGNLLLRRGNTAGAAAEYRRAAGQRPTEPWYLANLAYTEARQGRDHEARRLYGAVTRLDPGWPREAARLAWALATHPDPAHRDPTDAVRIAEEVTAATERRDAAALDVLAAAYAAVGRFADAAATAREALARARAVHPDLAAGIETRLRLYEQGKPYREGPGEPDRTAHAAHPGP